ncbi:hypothetical protein ISS07_03220 [Candidatus Woesearchaeota archaeon]|nr:hypothetical protein [Candidatus Woesearchaeota archaeon]
MKTNTLKTIFLILALAIFSAAVFAQPQGPASLAEGADERRDGGVDITTGTLTQADAGNMTSMTINSTVISSRWQGYYGNVTGTITLDDGQNNTLYSWQLINPQGEIYAVNDSKTVQWTQVQCLNFSVGSTRDNVTLAALENSLGMGTNDVDGVNETFNLSRGGSFTVGSSVTIGDDSGCSWVSLNTDNGPDTVRFNETILSDNTSNHNVIYTTVIEESLTGFSGSSLDFQMIVGDDGDTVAATDYYFYVELS